MRSPTPRQLPLPQQREALKQPRGVGTGEGHGRIRGVHDAQVHASGSCEVGCPVDRGETLRQVVCAHDDPPARRRFRLPDHDHRTARMSRHVLGDRADSGSRRRHHARGCRRRPGTPGRAVDQDRSRVPVRDLDLDVGFADLEQTSCLVRPVLGQAGGPLIRPSRDSVQVAPGDADPQRAMHRLGVIGCPCQRMLCAHASVESRDDPGFSTHACTLPRGDLRRATAQLHLRPGPLVPSPRVT